jgi:hypothetical protein
LLMARPLAIQHVTGVCMSLMDCGQWGFELVEPPGDLDFNKERRDEKKNTNMIAPVPRDETAIDGESALDTENSRGNSLEEPLLSQAEHLRLQEDANDEIRRSRATIQLYKLAAWMFVLTLAWLASKGWCYVGLPYDCQKG